MPWSALIAAVATLAGVIVGLVVGGRRDDRNRRADVRREAYAGLVAAANAAADYYNARRPHPPPPDDIRANELLIRFNQAVALVQLTGSRRAAEPTYPLAEAGSAGNLEVDAGAAQFREALAEFVSAARFEINPEMEIGRGWHPGYRRALRQRVW